LITRGGKLEGRVPQDRPGRFRTEVFERSQRREKALLGALAESYGPGVSTRPVKAITEEWCGHEFSASTLSRINQHWDEELEKLAPRRLEEAYPSLILDARYQKVREDGAIRSRAVLVAIGMKGEGRRSVLAVELAQRASPASWRDFLLSLRQRGLRAVEGVISDDQAGLKKAMPEMLPEAAGPSCYLHFLRNALDYLPRKADDDGLLEWRWRYDRRTREEARAE
jgi:transposase-like protein